MANTKKKEAQSIKPMTDRDIDVELRKMGESVRNQPIVPVRVPLDPMADSKDQVMVVCVNGHRFNIPRGVTVNVPNCIRELLESTGNI